MTKILTVPNPILREKSKPLAIDKKTAKLVKTLRETLIGKEGKAKGVGLAAVQIGFPKRVFLAYSPASKIFLTFINPEIIWCSKRVLNPKKSKLEGCLSIPNRWAFIQRAKEIKIRYQSESGQILVRRFSGVLATVIQHEYDHLEGRLFIDRALEQKAKIFELVKDEDEKERLEEVKIC